MATDDLKDLLSERAAAGDPQALDARFWDRFGIRRAVLFSDMSGFSRLTEGRGVPHVVGLILRMRTLCCRAVERHGRVEQCEADNVFATFASPQAAVAAARAMQRACTQDSVPREPDERIRLGIGIGWGDMLDLDGHGLFGHEVNMASRLGEDLATSGEILVTDAVQQELKLSGERCSVVVSGMSVTYWRLSEG